MLLELLFLSQFLRNADSNFIALKMSDFPFFIDKLCVISISFPHSHEHLTLFWQFYEERRNNIIQGREKVDGTRDKVDYERKNKSSILIKSWFRCYCAIVYFIAVICAVISISKGCYFVWGFCFLPKI